jgi:hypothetical protein
MNEPERQKERSAFVFTAVVFVILAPLAFLTAFVFEGPSIWVRIGFGVAACFFGWLLFLASPRTRVLVLRWCPFIPFF